MTSDPTDDRGCHVDERSSQHVGEDERPRARDGFRPAACQLKPVVHAVDTGILRGNSEGVIVEIDAEGSLHPHHQRSKGKHARPCPNVEHGIKILEDYTVINCKDIVPGWSVYHARWEREPARS